MTIKAVIFDMDGTITQPLLDFDLIRDEMGIDRNAGSILEVLDEMSPERRKQALAVLERHEDRAAELSTLNYNAKETLDALRKASIKIGILTRNKRLNVSAVTNKHDLSFDAVCSREDGPAKPDAFGVQHLCSIFNVKTTETIVVGDYLDDLLCAKAAGATAVLINTHKHAQQFSQHADFTIDTLDEIINIIQNLSTEGV